MILRSATTEIRVNIGARAGSELEPTAMAYHVGRENEAEDETRRHW